METQDWICWQLVDSAFPSGGFAHSAGLEAALQSGEVQGPQSLASFITASLLQAGRAALPLVGAARDHPAQLAELDHLANAFLTNHVANRASRAQGRALASAAHKIYHPTPAGTLRDSIEANHLPGHLAPVFGAITGLLAFSRRQAAAMYLFMTLRSLISAAVRLGIVGPLEAQRLQHQLSPHVQRMMQRFADTPLDMIAQTAPLIDVVQGMHDRLYSRLFQS